MLTSANTSRTGPSVLEAPGGQPIIDCQDLGLTARLLAPQGAEAELVVVQVHFTAHQAIGPHLAELPGPPQQAYLAEAVAASQVDEPTPRPFLQVQLPGIGERPTVRSGLDARRPLLPQGLDVLLGVPLHVPQVGVLEARPD